MPPYPGIPYGQAPAWCFPVFECSMYVLLILCLVHAAKRGTRGVTYILGGVAFGLILEYIEVITGSYTYGRFMVMFGRPPLDIPLCIGAGWGIIMYTARLFSDSLRLPLLACAALDTLLALNIDLSMDTVAYRLHMWHWNWSSTHLNPLTAQWFGIPYGNFVGWQTVVFCYSGFSRLFEKKLLRRDNAPIYKFILVALLALICSQLILFSTETFVHPLMAKIGMLSMQRFIGYSVIFMLLIIWAWRNKTATSAPIPLFTWWVPGWFHLFFFACFFMLGFYTENKWMTLAAYVNLIIGVLIHSVPVWLKRTRTIQV